MKHAVMLFPFHSALSDGSLEPEALIAQLAAHGASGVEIMQGFETRSPAVFRRLLAAVRSHGLRVVCNDIGVNLLTTGREAAFAKVRRHLEWTAQTVPDCRTVLLYDNIPEPAYDGVLARRLYSDALRTLSETARKLGITLTIEDYDPSAGFACSSRDCRSILDGTGGCAKATFDTGNFLTENEWPTAAFPVLRELIHHVHLKDMRAPSVPGGKASGCPAGEGDVDFRTLYASFRGMGYDGWLSVEIYNRSVPEALRALDYFHTL